MCTHYNVCIISTNHRDRIFHQIEHRRIVMGISKILNYKYKVTVLLYYSLKKQKHNYPKI